MDISYDHRVQTVASSFRVSLLLRPPEILLSAEPESSTVRTSRRSSPIVHRFVHRRSMEGREDPDVPPSFESRSKGIVVASILRRSRTKVSPLDQRDQSEPLLVDRSEREGETSSGSKSEKSWCNEILGGEGERESNWG